MRAKACCVSIIFALCVVVLVPVNVNAHEVKSLNGQKSTHQHVYKRNAYGKGATAGHYARPAGSNGIVIWSSTPNKAYGKPLKGFTVPRNGHTQPSQKSLHTQDPLIDQQLQQPRGYTPRFPR